MTWEVLAAHARATQPVRVGREPRATDEVLPVEPEEVMAYRIGATHLDQRLDPGSYPAAAGGGLQDSAPRDALLALHARVEEVGPSGWEDPTLAQIWFRWSDYVVPRDDIGVFTLGALPRDPARRAALEQLADQVLVVLDGEPMSSRNLAGSIRDLPSPHWLRMLSATGKVHIRWDARTIDVLPAKPAALDEEEARVELARRFLRWLGPANHQHFARWAGVSRDDAAVTWQALADEIVPVAVAGRVRSLLAEDEPALRAPTAKPRGVRLIVGGDPVLYLDRDLVVPPVPRSVAERQPGPGVTQRVLNSLWGRVLLDGRIVASWGRSGGDVTIAPWEPLSARRSDRIAAAATALSTPLDRPIRLRWLL